jgi:hypothetical protein
LSQHGLGARARYGHLTISMPQLTCTRLLLLLLLLLLLEQ